MLVRFRSRDGGTSIAPATLTVGGALGRAVSRGRDESRTGSPQRIPRRAFTLLCLAAFVEFLGIGITIIALPRFVTGGLHRGDLAVGVAVGAFAIGAIGIRLFAGRWGDRYGRRVLMLFGLALTGLPLALTGLATGYAALLAFRVVTGLGQALFFVGGATLAADLAPEHRRGEALSLFSLPLYLGLGLGPTIGEWVTTAYSAQAAFLVAGTIPFLGLALAPFVAEPSRGTPDPGVSTSRRWLHPAAIGPGSVMLLGLVGFIGFNAYLPLYAPQIHLARPGLVFLMYSVLVMLVRVLGARLPDRLGAGRTGTAATCAIAAGLTVVATVPHPVGVFAGTAVLALGMALQYPALMSLAVGRAPEHERARVVSTFSGFFDLAQAGGGAVLGVAAAGLGYRAAFGCGALAGLLALGVLRLRVVRPERVVDLADEPQAWAPAGAE